MELIWPNERDREQTSLPLPLSQHCRLLLSLTFFFFFFLLSPATPKKKKFGVTLIDEALIERFERVTGHRAHPLLRRKLVFAHRDLNLILDAYEKNEAIYLYTGRGPSSEALHLGHLIPFMFTLWLQKALGGCPLVIQLTDDEKTLCRTLELERAQELCASNIKDIIAVGFDPSNTFIFSDFEYMGGE